MKPRIFVSSTYFDLKHVRERLERFIENYYFEPVLFESDNVIFEHNKPLDLSCYNEVKLCHMMVLIIGGRYGSVISGDNTKEKKEFYNNDYISVTRKEFETAQQLNIPVFIFVEKNVYAEYHTYNKNKKFFENQIDLINEKTFSFAHVDDINVFKFINAVERIAIKTFEKIEDIENYLGSQIAGMLYLYLQQLQDKKEEEKLIDSVSELKNISQRMNEMIIAVGKNVIKDNSFEEVLNNQNKILIEFFMTQFSDNIDFQIDYDIPEDELNSVFLISKKTIFNIDNFNLINNTKSISAKYNIRDKIIKEFKTEIEAINKNIEIAYFSYNRIYESYFTRIYPVLKNNTQLQDFFDKKLKETFKEKIFLDLPF